jgi:hypothetical protein
MAILSILPGVEVNIQSQGETLPEYVDETPFEEWDDRKYYDVGADRWMSTYVECVSDSEFQLKLSLRPGFHFRGRNHLSLVIFIDGQAVCASRFSKAGGRFQTSIVSKSVMALSPSEVTGRKFRFTSIQKGIYLSRLK